VPPGGVGDVCDDLSGRPEDLMIANAQHVPTKLAERAVPRGIMPSAVLVAGPVHLHDEPHLGAGEVHKARRMDAHTVRDAKLDLPAETMSLTGFEKWEGVEACRIRVYTPGPS
jgi:hypothetical protein